MDFPINPPIGERVRRKETQRFITGTGRYVDDLLPAGTLHVSFVRSSCAHAKIKSIDVEAARSMPGVHAVFTGKDIAQHVKPLRVGGSSVLRPVKLYPLAVDKDSLLRRALGGRGGGQSLSGGRCHRGGDRWITNRCR